MAAAKLACFARDGDFSAVRVALSSGTDPNSKHKGQTPLMFAAEKGHLAVMELLLANGAKVDVLDSYNRTALHFATLAQSAECCRLLVTKGASIEVESTLGGESPFDIAKMRSIIDIQKIFQQVRDGTFSTDVNQVGSGAPRINIFGGAPLATTAGLVDEDRALPEELLPVAMSFPRRAPQAEVDELRRHVPAPRATE